jgi:hypothetical protein
LLFVDLVREGENRPTKREGLKMKLTIVALRNAENRNTLEHKPIVQLNDGMPQSRGCMTRELLDYMISAGVSEEEINRGRREIEENGQTVLESTKITEAELERVLEPEEDLGKVLFCRLSGKLTTAENGYPEQ